MTHRDDDLGKLHFVDDGSNSGRWISRNRGVCECFRIYQAAKVDIVEDEAVDKSIWRSGHHHHLWTSDTELVEYKPARGVHACLWLFVGAGDTGKGAAPEIM